jgi:thioredoxin-related protein
MKTVVLIFATFILPLAGFCQSGPAKNEANDKEIHWITSIDELQAKMQQNPKKVIIDMYTGWCGWCKKMDAATYTNPALVKYINNNYYAVKFDAERQDVINFMGKEYKYDPTYKANALAIELMMKNNPQGQMSYPTTIFLLENFQSPTPIPGYRDVKEMQLFLTYFGDNAYKHQKYEDYSKSFVSTWDHGKPADNTPPAHH